jgi:hyperosmotically inducible periplasmic protein
MDVMRNTRSIVTAAAVAAFAAASPFDALAQDPQKAQPASAAGASVLSAKDSKAADRQLRKAVVHALSRTRGLVPTSITVRATNGDVILEGGVPEESQMTLATKAAEGVPGVKSVKNMLTLSQF